MDSRDLVIFESLTRCCKNQFLQMVFYDLHWQFQVTSVTTFVYRYLCETTSKYTDKAWREVGGIPVCSLSSSLQCLLNIDFKYFAKSLNVSSGSLISNRKQLLVSVHLLKYSQFLMIQCSSLAILEAHCLKQINKYTWLISC